MSDTEFWVELQAVIRQRLADVPEGSYTAKLASQGMLKVAQKLGEEGVELALAAAAQDQARVTAAARTRAETRGGRRRGGARGRGRGPPAGGGPGRP